MQADAVASALAQAHRSEWAFVLSATVRVAGNLDLAEECTQEAYISALRAWTRDGVPERPGAWLTTAARNHALDRLRRDVTLRRKLPLLVEPAAVDPHEPAELDWPDVDVPDDRLRLVFTCCHPTLAPEARVALTLRLVCGVPTPEVARAFLVSESTMAARITRAKKKISDARIPYRVPSRAELPERLDSVLTAVEQMARHQTGSLVVQEGSEIVGIFTERDLALRVVLPQRDTRATLVRDVMTPQVFCVRPEMRLSDAMALMTQQRVRHLPVVEAGAVCGVISIGDLVKCVASEQEMELRYLAAYIRGEYAV